MEIKSKFNLNQKVFIIHKYGENKFVECDTCGGLGGITQNKKLFTCQDCYGHRGQYKWIPEKWKLRLSKATIGKISIELYAKKSKGKDKISCMVFETGVGSGSIWYEDDVFATEKEALAECEIRNKKDKK